MNTLYCVCRFYMFGCVTVDSAGDFTYVEAPQATWFNGTATEDWTGLISQHCGSILSRSRHHDHDLIFISTMSRSFMRKAVKHADEAPLNTDKF